MKKNYKLLATLVLSGLAGAAFGVLPAEAAVTVGSADGTEKSLTNTEFTSLYGNKYTDSTSGNTVSISGEGDCHPERGNCQPWRIKLHR